MIPKLGKTIRFIPHIHKGDKSQTINKPRPGAHTVVGRITYINHAHRYFLAETSTGYRECFKF